MIMIPLLPAVTRKQSSGSARNVGSALCLLCGTRSLSGFVGSLSWPFGGGDTAGRVHRGGSKAQATKVVSQNTPTFLVETFLTSGYRQRLLPPSSSIGWVPGLGTTSTTSATPRTRTNSASGDIIQRMPHPNPKSAPTTRRSFQQSEV